MSDAMSFERTLPGILEQLAGADPPDYSDAILAVTAAARQRPAWSFPARWLPVATGVERAPLVAVPGRAVVILIALLLALALGMLVVGGSARPDGVGRNGMIAFSDGHDIFVGDPISGRTTPIVAGPEQDREPKFSPDGTKLAFLRRDILADPESWFVVTARVDGSDVIDVSDEQHYRCFDWSPDGRSIIARATDGGLYELDPAGAHSTHFVPAVPDAPPPDVYCQLWPRQGEVLLVGYSNTTGMVSLMRVNVDGSGSRTVVDESAGFGSIDAVSSPDESTIAFAGFVNTGRCVDPASCFESALYSVNSDGTGLHRVTRVPPDVPDVVVGETRPLWSPDGSRIAFFRSLSPPTAYRGSPVEEPEGAPWPYTTSLLVVDVATGDEVEVDDSAWGRYDPNYKFSWSPDGRQILVTRDDPTSVLIVDAATGERRVLNWPVSSGWSWQALPAD